MRLVKGRTACTHSNSFNWPLHTTTLIVLIIRLNGDFNAHTPYHNYTRPPRRLFHLSSVMVDIHEQKDAFETTRPPRGSSRHDKGKEQEPGKCIHLYITIQLLIDHSYIQKIHTTWSVVAPRGHRWRSSSRSALPTSPPTLSSSLLPRSTFVPVGQYHGAQACS